MEFEQSFDPLSLAEEAWISGMVWTTSEVFVVAVPHQMLVLDSTSWLAQSLGEILERTGGAVPPTGDRDLDDLAQAGFDLATTLAMGERAKVYVPFPFRERIKVAPWVVRDAVSLLEYAQVLLALSCDPPEGVRFTKALSFALDCRPRTAALFATPLLKEHIKHSGNYVTAVEASSQMLSDFWCCGDYARKRWREIAS